jgi:hypothetical protein
MCGISYTGLGYYNFFLFSRSRSIDLKTQGNHFLHNYHAYFGTRVYDLWFRELLFF